jgi:hypothetical protein
MPCSSSRSLTVYSSTAPTAPAVRKRELARWGFRLPPELVRSARPARYGTGENSAHVWDRGVS